MQTSPTSRPKPAEASRLLNAVCDWCFDRLIERGHITQSDGQRFCGDQCQVALHRARKRAIWLAHGGTCACVDCLG